MNLIFIYFSQKGGRRLLERGTNLQLLFVKSCIVQMRAKKSASVPFS